MTPAQEPLGTCLSPRPVRTSPLPRRSQVYICSVTQFFPTRAHPHGRGSCEYGAPARREDVRGDSREPPLTAGSPTKQCVASFHVVPFKNGLYYLNCWFVFSFELTIKRTMTFWHLNPAYPTPCPWQPSHSQSSGNTPCLGNRETSAKNTKVFQKEPRLGSDWVMFL